MSRMPFPFRAARVHIFCTNSLSCKAQIVYRLTHYASRNAMDIEMFSDKTAGMLIEQLNISSIRSCTS